ncbi:MAG: type II secretion system protein [Chlamydiae bacterium]|nr:type II secretion system protein [Chlamydiota bacterium]MBI3276962.1 type II secretion system protein [Chlamydiota bacterium]
MKSQKGFTLIELIVVLTILAILAVFAIPRFITVTADARVAAINGLKGSVLSATSLAKAKYKAVGNTSATTVDMDGTSVTVTSGTGANAGVPVGTSAGITSALQSTDGFTATYAAGVATFNFTTAVTNCNLTYTDPAGTVATTTTGC